MTYKPGWKLAVFPALTEIPPQKVPGLTVPLTLVFLKLPHEPGSNDGAEMYAKGSPKCTIPVVGGVLPPPLTLVPPTTPTSGAVTVPPPLTVSAVESFALSYR